MSKKILVIDDEAKMCAMIKERLAANGYDVLIAHDGQKGMDMAQKEVPDLILMDIMMPNLNGGDAVRLLKSSAKTSSIPVIFLTAVVTKQEEDVGQHVNIDNRFIPAIAKPFDPDEFLAKIKETVGG